MANSFVFDDTHRLLEKSIGISAKRHGIISSNIANISTVHYKSKDLDFDKLLKKEMNQPGTGLETTHSRHFPAMGGLSDPYASGLIENKEAGVDIDVEMTHLAENNLKYRTSIEMLLRKINSLRHAISEGGR